MEENILCGTGAGDRLRNLGDLVARPDDWVTLVILNDIDLLVLLLSALPNLNLTASTDNTNSHGGE